MRATVAARPWLADVAMTAVLYIVLTVAITTAGELDRPHGQLIGAAANLVLVGPLVWRRQAPLGVLGVIGCATVISSLALGTTGGEAALLVAAATVVDREERWRRAVTAVAVTAVGAAGVVIALEPTEPIKLIANLLVLLVAASAVGVAVRSRRAQLAALTDRAARLRREQAQQAELAVASERARIARELHDIVAHNVTVIVALADGASLSATRAPDQAQAAMGQVAMVGRETLTELRELLGVLRDDVNSTTGSELRPQPGIATLDELMERVRGAGLNVRLRIEGEPVALRPVVQLTIYRITQEALTNVLRHARHASSAQVQLRYLRDAVELEITDNGLPTTAPHAVGRGLTGMRERTGAHGATLTWGPDPAAGWRVATQIPLQEPVHEESTAR